MKSNFENNKIKSHKKSAESIKLKLVKSSFKKDNIIPKSIEENLSQKFLEGFTSAAILVRYTSKEIVASNEAAKKIGISIGNTCYKTWAKQDKPCSWCEAPKLSETEGPIRCQKENLGKIWNIHWVPISNEYYLHYFDDITDQKQKEKELQIAKNNLHNKNKELNCLCSISYLLEKPNATLENTLQGTVDIIPPSWQYPKITCAKITVDNIEYKTVNYLETKWQLKSGILINNKPIGTIEVNYLKKMPEIDEGPFLKEERLLIDAIAMRLGEIVEQQKTDEAYKQSEEKYRDLIESNPYGFQVIDTNGMILYSNPAQIKMYGYTEEELIGKSILDFLVSDKERDNYRNLLQILVTEQPEPTPYRVQNNTKDGRIIDLEVSWGYQRNSDNEVIGFTSIITNITQSLQAEISLKENEQLMRKIAENYPNSYISVIDNNYTIIFTSGQEFKKLNQDPEQFIGKNITQYFDEKTDTVKHHFAKAFQGENSVFEIYANNHYQLLRVVPLKVENGTISKILVVTENITIQKQDERALKLTNDILKIERSNLEEKNIALKELISEIESEKNKTKNQIKTNFDKTVLPLLQKMSTIADTTMLDYINILKTNLVELTSPFIKQLENKYEVLTPREIEVCNLIKMGLSTKEIATTFNTSVFTVNNQRQQIRKKLHISGANNNLTSFLHTIK